MTQCLSHDVDLRRGDRIFIGWTVSGLADVATVFVSLEAGPWLPLDIGVGEVIGYFAGPDYVSPGAARVVPATSYTEIRVVTGETTETFPGGFIRLVP